MSLKQKKVAHIPFLRVVFGRVLSFSFSVVFGIGLSRFRSFLAVFESFK